MITDDRVAAALHYVVEKGWRIGNVAVRELADHTPVNYVSAIWGAGPLPSPTERSVTGDFVLTPASATASSPSARAS